VGGVRGEGRGHSAAVDRRLTYRRFILLSHLLPRLNEFLELFDYNAWANRTIFDAVAQLPDDQYFRDLKSSYGGIHGTLAHIVWAEQLWLTRWLGQPAPAVAQGKDLGSLAEVRARWEAVELERGPFLQRLTDATLAATLTVTPSMGGAYVHTYGQTLQHVVDHASYHRGQVITLLRQLGAEAASTDLLVYYDEKPKKIRMAR